MAGFSHPEAESKVLQPGYAWSVRPVANGEWIWRIIQADTGVVRAEGRAGTRSIAAALVVRQLCQRMIGADTCSDHLAA